MTNTLALEKSGSSRLKVIALFVVSAGLEPELCQRLMALSDQLLVDR